MEAKYVIRIIHGEFLEGGEVVKETDTSYFVKPVENYRFACGRGRFPKKEVVFVSCDRVKFDRLLALYTVIGRQHRAVIDAAEKAFREALAVIIAQNPGKARNISIPEGPSHAQA